MGNLSAHAIKRLDANRKVADGLGLYIFTTARPPEFWLWRFLYTLNGKRHEMTLGPLADISLADARELAADARKLVRAGVCPIDARKAARAVPSDSITFGDFCDTWVKGATAGMRSERYAAQVQRELKAHLAPLREMTLASIDTKAVKETLLPIWQRTPTTARRIREKLESLLDAAAVEGLRRGENPARFKGHLEFVMPKAAKVIRKHHAALAYEDVPAFLKTLRADTSVGALALEFTILTAARTGEALGARWSEFDLQKKTWTIPAVRMKAGRPHTVPLSEAALAVIETMKSVKTSDLVFAGRGKDGGVSPKIMNHVLTRTGVSGTTVHGFRSAFRDWAGNETDTPREVAEAALAHVVGDHAEQAYRRSDALEKRRKLMDAWADFVAPVSA